MTYDHNYDPPRRGLARGVDPRPGVEESTSAASDGPRPAIYNRRGLFFTCLAPK